MGLRSFIVVPILISMAFQWFGLISRCTVDSSSTYAPSETGRTWTPMCNQAEPHGGPACGMSGDQVEKYPYADEHDQDGDPTYYETVLPAICLHDDRNLDAEMYLPRNQPTAVKDRNCRQCDNFDDCLDLQRMQPSEVAQNRVGVANNGNTDSRDDDGWRDNSSPRIIQANMAAEA